MAWLTTRVQAKLTLADLSTIREHAVQHIEVHTGKVGGMFSLYAEAILALNISDNTDIFFILQCFEPPPPSKVKLKGRGLHQERSVVMLSFAIRPKTQSCCQCTHCAKGVLRNLFRWQNNSIQMFFFSFMSHSITVNHEMSTTCTEIMCVCV